MPATISDPLTGPRCAIARSLEVLGEKWTLLIVREAFWGSSRFSEFRDALGVASDILSDRLATLVTAGVLERTPYREHGSRERFSYRLTPAGRDLVPVLAALNAWGEAHRASGWGPGGIVRDALTHEALTIGFRSADGEWVHQDRVEVVRGRVDS